MKLRFTTKSFIISCFLYNLFRTLQIMFLTDSETRFLKPELIWLDIILTIVFLLPVVYTVANTYYAFRCPVCVGKTGICGAVVGIVSGILLTIPIFMHIFSTKPSLISILLPALGVVSCFWLAASELFGFNLPKPAFLPLLASTLYGFINAYTVYTSHPLRARTIYEIIAIAFSVLFFLYLSKAHSDVKPEKNFRLLYPLGFASAVFCFTATIPEIVATVCGFGDNVATHSISPFVLLGLGIITTYITLASNTYKNTKKSEE